MSDIYIDFDVLDRVRRDIRRIAEIMERPGREMGEVNGNSMGVPELAWRMNEFGDEWSYGIKQISKFSDSAGKSLDEIKESFEGLDGKLASELRESKEKGR